MGKYSIVNWEDLINGEEFVRECQNLFQKALETLGKKKFAPKCVRKGQIHFRKLWEDKIYPKITLGKTKTTSDSSGKVQITQKCLRNGDICFRNHWKNSLQPYDALKKVNFTLKSIGKMKFAPNCAEKCKIQFKKRWEDKIHPKRR